VPADGKLAIVNLFIHDARVMVSLILVGLGICKATASLVIQLGVEKSSL